MGIFFKCVFLDKDGGEINFIFKNCLDWKLCQLNWNSIENRGVKILTFKLSRFNLDDVYFIVILVQK